MISGRGKKRGEIKICKQETQDGGEETETTVKDKEDTSQIRVTAKRQADKRVSRRRVR